MEKTVRKCVTLKQKNVENIENMLKKSKYKNFSQALDSAIEDCVQGELLDDCGLSNIPKDITFVNVAKKIMKGAKNGD